MKTLSNDVRLCYNANKIGISDVFPIQTKHGSVFLHECTRDEPEVIYETKTRVLIRRQLSFKNGAALSFYELARLGKPRKDGSRLAGKTISFSYPSE